MPTRLVKSFWFLVSSIVVTFLFGLGISFANLVSDAHAISPSPLPSYQPIATNNQQPSYSPLPQYSNQSPQFMNLIMINIVHTISCLAEGTSIIGQSCIGFTTQQQGNQLGLVPVEVKQNQGGGALGSIGDVLTLAYSTPPTRTAEYIADLGNRLNLVPEAHAQVAGSGSNVIEPVKKIWELSRNLAYLGMTVIFLIIGFMIMFRRKLNPQTVVNIQSALPGLVIGLILITFSYFISALVIDLSFVSTNVVSEVFIAAKLANPAATSNVRDGNIFKTFGAFFTGDKALDVANETATTLAFLKEGTVGNIIKIMGLLIGCKLGASIGGAFGAAGIGIAGTAAAPILAVATGPLAAITAPLFGGFGNSVGQGVGCVVGAGAVWSGLQFTQLFEWITGLVLYLVLIVALLVAMFKILFATISAYVNMVILTLTAPMRFLLGSLPGSKGGFTPWLKELLANVLIFPAFYVVFFIVGYILGGDIANNLGIINPLSDASFQGGAVPFLNGLSTLFLRMVLGYGFLLLAPNLPDMIKGALGVKDPGYSKMAIGAVVGGFGIGRNLFRKTAEIPMKERAEFQQARMKHKMTVAAGQASGNPVPWYWGSNN